MRKKQLAALLGAAVIGWTCFAPETAAAEEALPEFTLEGLNVTALGYEESNLDTPADISVYSGEALRKTGARDVAGALKYQSGILFTSMGPHDQSFITSNSAVDLRGVGGGTLVLINGVPASFNNASHLDMVSLDQVERVEVVKGGGAVLYGSEAYGGVINVITKDRLENTVRVSAGSKGQRSYAATFGAGKAGFSIGRDEMGETGNLSKKMGSKKINGVDIPYYVGFGDSQKDHIGFNYAFDDRFKFRYMLNRKKYTIDYNDAAENNLQHFMYDDREQFAQLSFADNGWDATAYYNRRDIDNPDYYVVRPNNREWEKSDHRQYGTNAKKVWTRGEDKALLGFAAKRETYSNDNQKFSSFGNSASSLKPVAHFGTYGLNEYSLYAQYDKKVDERSRFILSMREDAVRSDSGDYDAFLPQFQWITRVGKDSSVYANVGKSFRMPTFRQLYYSSGVLAANTDLDPEHGWNYEVGYKKETASTTWKAALFRIELKDQISTRKNAQNLTEAYNAARYKNTGLELSYAKKLDEYLSYTFGGIYHKPEKKDTTASPWKDTLGRYQFSTALQYQNGRTDAALSLSYLGDRVKYSDQSDAGALFLSNLHLGYGLTENTSLSFDIDNLFDRKDLSNSDGNYYTLGRVFRVGMQCKF